MGKLSSGFAGASTRSLEGVQREIESRIAKAEGFVDPGPYDPETSGVFPEDFAPGSDASRDVPRGTIAGKRAAPYEAAHDDIPSGESRYRTARELRREVLMAAAGDVKDQEPMNRIDEAEQRRTGHIKPPGEQFPMKARPAELPKTVVSGVRGRLSKEPASEVAAFDVHATDPARLRAEVRRDVGAK